MDWQYSVRKIGAILQTVVHLGMHLMEFFCIGMHLNNINAMNKRQMICLKDTRVPTCVRVCACVCVCVCPRVRARVGTCVCACAWVRVSFRVSFRVGACAWVRARMRVRVWVGWGARPPVLWREGRRDGSVRYTTNTKG